MRTLAILTLALVANQPALAQNQGGSRVQIAIVVDVSQSLRGFTEATRQRVLTLAQNLTGGADGDTVDLALLAYGNRDDESVEVVVPLTGEWFIEAGDIVWNGSSNDSQRLSQVFNEALLKGGAEGCGKSLQSARLDLDWTEDQNAKRFVIIAGNESFDQGNPSGTSEAQKLPRHFKRKRVPLPNGGSTIIDIPMPITLQTIHAGMRAEGKRNEWERAAQLGGGDFDNVDPNSTR